MRTKLDIYVFVILVRLYCLIITIDCVTNQSINHISYIIRYLNWQKNVHCFISTIYCVAYIYEGRILRCFMSEIKIENLILFVVSRLFSVSEGGNITVTWSFKNKIKRRKTSKIFGHLQSRAKSIRGKWRTSRLSCLALAILNLRKSKIS